MQDNNMKETILRISGVDVLKCMRCGKCSGTCPSYDEMEYIPMSSSTWWKRARSNR